MIYKKRHLPLNFGSLSSCLTLGENNNSDPHLSQLC